MSILEIKYMKNYLSEITRRFFNRSENLGHKSKIKYYVIDK